MNPPISMQALAEKLCPRCYKQIENPRKKYCSESCKWWYNSMKKDRESHLPPLNKRNRNFFYMIVGVERAKMPGVRQGRRSGGMITGSMSAMIYSPTEEVVPITPENLARHFMGIPTHNYIPNYIRLGDQTRVKRGDIFSELGIKETT